MNDDIHWYDEVDSTNRELARMLRADPALAQGCVVAARNQTAGRGRYARTWTSMPGRDLTFSLLIREHARVERVPALAMATALGIDDFLRTYNIASRPKWPNDVLVGCSKICGILAERLPLDREGLCGIVLGIGLNVNMDAVTAGHIDRPVTSMLLETGCVQPVEELLPLVLDRLDPWIEAWRHAGFSALRETWQARTILIGSTVTVRDGERMLSGRLAGYGAYGQLLLRDDQHREHELWGGMCEEAGHNSRLASGR